MTGSTKPAADQQAADAKAKAEAQAKAKADAVAKAAADKEAADAKAKAAKGILVVVGPEQGRRRAGRHFSREETRIPLAELSDAEIEAIQRDPVLSSTIEK